MESILPLMHLYHSNVFGRLWVGVNHHERKETTHLWQAYARDEVVNLFATRQVVKMRKREKESEWERKGLLKEGEVHGEVARGNHT